MSEPAAALDPLSASAGASALGGLLALGEPTYLGLAVAAAALAAVLWLCRGGGATAAGRRSGAVVLAASWGFALLAPPALGGGRGLALGSGALLLWASERGAPRRPPEAP